MTDHKSGPSAGIDTAAPWHAQEATAVLAALGAAETGLGADEVARRLAEHGPNRLPEPPRRSTLLRFLGHMNNVLIHVLIEPRYAPLVRTSTRFWNASGITLKGGLSGVEVKSESLQTLLSGGIAFETPDLQAVRSDRAGQRFALHADRDSALQLGKQITIRVAHGLG